mmetsp:Transcript_9466/g.13100  ORF Transcript_9466/g.13100 Transcript_9466/m.13100 type:complete len:139 (-) Transcript_9466:184-600(-)
MSSPDSCQGQPIQKVLKSSKNVLLVCVLMLAVMAILFAYTCDIEKSEQTLVVNGKEAEETFCIILTRKVSPTYLFYFGFCIVFAWCCCPCFKLECDHVDLESRSCFLRAIQRRRRIRRARNMGIRSAAEDDVDDEEEP